MEKKLPAGVAAVLDRLAGAGYEAYLVGGCVRDRYMGVAPHDYDITTSALPQETVALFARVVETGIAHGTVTVLTHDGPVEVTTYRQDGEYSDHRHPDGVQFTRSLQEDLARRDFTMNAMAMDGQGRIVDPFGGREDIDQKTVRCVGEPDRRFEEDALRILRGLRFAARLGFAIAPATAAAMEGKKELLKEIAAERVFTELCGLLQGAYAAEILATHREIIAVVLPELKGIFDFPQNSPYHYLDVWQHTLQVVAEAPAEPTYRMAALLHDIGKPATQFSEEGVDHFYGHEQKSAVMAAAILSRLKVSNAFRDEVLMLIAKHDEYIPATRQSVRRRCAKIGAGNLLKLLELQRADDRAKAQDRRRGEAYFDAVRALVEELLQEGACLSLKDLAVDGKDLLSLGIQGAAIGKTLNFLLEQVTEEKLPNEKEALLNKIKNR